MVLIHLYFSAAKNLCWEGNAWKSIFPYKVSLMRNMHRVSSQLYVLSVFLLGWLFEICVLISYAIFRYTLFWVLLLGCKFTVSYLVQVRCYLKILWFFRFFLMNYIMINYCVLNLLSVFSADKTSGEANERYYEHSSHRVWMAWIFP